MFITYSKNGRNADGVTESIAHAGKLSIGLMRETGSGKNESIPTVMMLENASATDTRPVDRAAIWEPADAKAPGPKPQGNWIGFSIPGMKNLA